MSATCSARRPSTTPSASMTCHLRWSKSTFGKYVFISKPNKGTWKLSNVRLKSTRDFKLIGLRPYRRAAGAWSSLLISKPASGHKKYSTAEIRALYLRIPAQRRRVALQRDFARLQNVAKVGNFQCAVRVLLHQQNRQAALAVDLHNLFKNRFPQQGREADRRFVQHQEFRLRY